MKTQQIRKTVGKVFFEQDCYDFEDEEMNLEAEANPNGIIRVEAGISEKGWNVPYDYTMFGMRRRIEGKGRKLKIESEKILQLILDKFVVMFNSEASAFYNKNAGCTMCPCSGGYDIKVAVTKENEEYVKLLDGIQKKIAISVSNKGIWGITHYQHTQRKAWSWNKARINELLQNVNWSFGRLNEENKWEVDTK